MNKVIITAAVTTAFDFAVTAFRDRTSCSHWRDLETAMWALQRVQKMSEVQADDYVGTPLDQLVGKLAKDHRQESGE